MFRRVVDCDVCEYLHCPSKIPDARRMNRPNIPLARAMSTGLCSLEDSRDVRSNRFRSNKKELRSEPTGLGLRRLINGGRRSHRGLDRKRFASGNVAEHEPLALLCYGAPDVARNGPIAPQDRKSSPRPVLTVAS